MGGQETVSVKGSAKLRKLRRDQNFPLENIWQNFGKHTENRKDTDHHDQIDVGNRAA